MQSYRCGLSYALVSLGTIFSYAAFTFAVTQWRQVCVCVGVDVWMCMDVWMGVCGCV